MVLFSYPLIPFLLRRAVRTVRFFFKSSCTVHRIFRLSIIVNMFTVSIIDQLVKTWARSRMESQYIPRERQRMKGAVGCWKLVEQSTTARIADRILSRKSHAPRKLSGRGDFYPQSLDSPREDRFIFSDFLRAPHSWGEPTVQRAHWNPRSAPSAPQTSVFVWHVLCVTCWLAHENCFFLSFFTALYEFAHSYSRDIHPYHSESIYPKSLDINERIID